MSRRILLLVILWLAPLASQAQPAHTVLVMGDSLSAAFGIDTSQGWVALLDARLQAQGYDYTVVNASVSGETTAGGLTRLTEALARHKPGIVVVELGANDGLRGTPIKAMQDNLGKMVALSRQAGAKVLLVGMLLPPNYGAAYTRDFRAAYTAVAKQYKTPLVPFLLDGVAQHRELMQADGLHPLAGAEPHVLDNIWPYLVPMLQKPVRSHQ
ncbi:MAG TPA: arylesterase [Gammaproteobacteria bacterium]